MKFRIIIFVSFLIYGCQNVDINDKDKRNENWMYWVDSSTGKTSWIPVSDQTTLKNGRFISFFKNGRIYQKGKFKNGECVDTIYCYDINENLQKYMLVKPDTLLHYYIKEGSYVAYFQSGKILEKGIIKNHKRGDQWTRYFENGKIEFIQDFKDGNGLTHWYYDNGQISDSAYTIKGKNQGKIKFWFKNGQIREISNWENGLQNGLCEKYYENGKLKECANWTNGKPEKCEGWYDNGQKKTYCILC